MTSRSYEGTARNCSWQHITEQPSFDEEAESSVCATDTEDADEALTEDVPVPTERFGSEASPETTGQTTFTDWGWSR